MSNIRNWHNADLKVGDRVTVTLRGVVTSVDSYLLGVEDIDSCDVYEFSPTDKVDVELNERPVDWTDGDVLQAHPSLMVWYRENSRWNSRGGNQNYSDTIIDKWIEDGAVSVLRKQSEEAAKADAEW